MKPRVLAFVLAGGRGSRPGTLTEDRAKPAVSFGGKYRIIDFVLSKLVNSDICAIYVLVQANSHSLLRHLRDGWMRTPRSPAVLKSDIPLRWMVNGIRSPRAAWCWLRGACWRAKTVLATS